MSALDRLAKSGTLPALAEYGDPGHIYAMDDERVYVDKAVADAALEELAEELLGTRVTLDAAIGDSDYFRAGRDRAEALLGWAWRQQCVRNFPMALQSTYQQWRADLERYDKEHPTEAEANRAARWKEEHHD